MTEIIYLVTIYILIKLISTLK